MKTIKLKTIAELHAKVQAGEIDGSQLRITLDNDCTSFELGPRVPDAYGDMEPGIEIEVKEANGYYDIGKLYPLLFPGATVEWC